MNYKRFGNKIVLRVKKGDEILETIKKVALKENVKLANITGLGATDDVSIGIYDTDKSEYLVNEFKESFEIVSLAGNISTMNDEYYAHLHIGLGDVQGNMFGGHLNKAIVSATSEIVLDIIDGTIDRFYDDETGLNLLDI